jgi:hypothetical protein
VELDSFVYGMLTTYLLTGIWITYLFWKKCGKPPTLSAFVFCLTIWPIAVLVMYEDFYDPNS